VIILRKRSDYEKELEILCNNISDKIYLLNKYPKETLTCLYKIIPLDDISPDIEIWKLIPTYESYLVSNQGRIYSLSHMKIMTPSTMNGYQLIGLTRDKKLKTYLIHRLVAQAFIPNPNNKPEVNHKDKDKSNNDVCNLEWVSKKENMKHAFSNNHNHVKLSSEDVRNICKLAEDGKFAGEIIRELNLYNVSYDIVYKIINGDKRTNITKDYNLTKPKRRILYSSDQIDKACKLWTEDKYSIDEISQTTGVSIPNLRQIFQGYNWKHISKKYGIVGKYPIYKIKFN